MAYPVAMQNDKDTMELVQTIGKLRQAVRDAQYHITTESDASILLQKLCLQIGWMSGVMQSHDDRYGTDVTGERP